MWGAGACDVAFGAVAGVNAGHHRIACIPSTPRPNTCIHRVGRVLVRVTGGGPCHFRPVPVRAAFGKGCTVCHIVLRCTARHPRTRPPAAHNKHKRRRWARSARSVPAAPGWLSPRASGRPRATTGWGHGRRRAIQRSALRPGRGHGPRAWSAPRLHAARPDAGRAGAWHGASPAFWRRSHDGGAAPSGLQRWARPHDAGLSSWCSARRARLPPPSRHDAGRCARHDAAPHGRRRTVWWWSRDAASAAWLRVWWAPAQFPGRPWWRGAQVWSPDGLEVLSGVWLVAAAWGWGGLGSGFAPAPGNHLPTDCPEPFLNVST